MIGTKIYCFMNYLKKKICKALENKEVTAVCPILLWIKLFNMPKARKSWVWRHFEAETDRDARFSLTLDEWTDLTGRRYLHVNLHDLEGTYNLGIIPVPTGHCTADVISQLVTSKLEEVGLSLTKHIVSSTTDGAKVMLKYGRITHIGFQACINHGIHLAVTDVLYKKKKKQT
ncbi:CLUMA_CG015396, isoform A, partial [Clunio marinus]